VQPCDAAVIIIARLMIHCVSKNAPNSVSFKAKT